MKILKIFGIVVGIHVFFFVLIFAIPGCSSTAKTSPQPAETVIRPASATPTPAPAPNIYSSTSEPTTPAFGGFNPDAPALSSSSSGIRVSPTRPNSPVAAPLAAEPVTDVTPATTYVVKSGDSLSAIAQRNKITVAQLTAANGISATAMLRPGQKLIIPAKTPAAPAAATASGSVTTPRAGNGAASTAARSTESFKHVVRSGETLGAIAKRYEVSVGQLAVANNISDPAKINAGTELIIPGWTPAGKNGKSKAGGNGTAKASAAPAPVSSEPPLPTPAETATPAPPPPVPVIRLDDTAPRN